MEATPQAPDVNPQGPQHDDAQGKGKPEMDGMPMNGDMKIKPAPTQINPH